MALYARIRRPVAAFCAILPLLSAAPVRAQGIPPLFSDTEVEQDLRVFCTPIWIAAGLNPDNIHLVLVNSDDLQAFVAGGQNIFIYTGLLMKTDNPLQIAGVVAHETGHIAGGHIVRSDADMENASYTMLLATVLGAAAAAGARDPGSAMAAMGIGEDMGIRSYLAFSRVKEASADEAGMTFLEKAQMSPVGLVEFMKKIEVEEGVPLKGDAKYLVDHPPTPERVEALVQGVKRSHYADTKVPAEWNELYARLKAKLIGYLQPEYALKKYSRADTSIAGRYGRSVALWRLGQIEPALFLANDLIAAEPNNPYFHQLKAQMLFESGRVAESIPAFQKAAALAPKGTDEIHTEYAQALLEREDKSVLPAAIAELNVALKVEPRSADTHRFLAIAYGREGNEAMSKLELAEQAILEGRIKVGRHLAEDAMHLLKAGSRDWLRAQDLVATSMPVKHDDDRSGLGGGSGLQFSVGPVDPANHFAGSQ